MEGFMKTLVLAFFLSSWTFAMAGEDSAKWSDVIESEQGQFTVSVHPKQKRVEIRKVDGTLTSSPYLRVRVLRENDRPLEIRLKAIERADSPLYYTGQVKQWRDSYIGLEIDFSFDKKTWKRLGRALKK